MANKINGMVEKRGSGLWLTHVFMVIGVLIIFFPIWLAFVASTVTQPEIVKPPMPLWPGDQLWENYSKALVSGINVPVSTMLVNSFVMAISIAVGKIIISLLSAFAIVYFRFPGRNFFFWMIFLTLMLPVEVRIDPTIPSGTFAERIKSFEAGKINQVNQVFYSFIHRKQQERILQDLGENLVNEVFSKSSFPSSSSQSIPLETLT